MAAMSSLPQDQARQGGWIALLLPLAMYSSDDTSTTGLLLVLSISGTMLPMTALLAGLFALYCINVSAIIPFSPAWPKFHFFQDLQGHPCHACLPPVPWFRPTSSFRCMVPIATLELCPTDGIPSFQPCSAFYICMPIN
jgi:hypothetical protein